jgi:hypothetical protein
MDRPGQELAALVDLISPDNRTPRDQGRGTDEKDGSATAILTVWAQTAPMNRFPDHICLPT